MGDYSDRVCPLILGTKLRKRDSIFWTNTWTIVNIDSNGSYSLVYDGHQQATTRRTKDQIREEFEYIFPYEYIKNYPKEDIE